MTNRFRGPLGLPMRQQPTARPKFDAQGDGPIFGAFQGGMPQMHPDMGPDTVDAKLRPGEYVLRPEAVQALGGPNQVDKLNAMGGPNRPGDFIPTKSSIPSMDIPPMDDIPAPVMERTIRRKDRHGAEEVETIKYDTKASQAQGYRDGGSVAYMNQGGWFGNLWSNLTDWNQDEEEYVDPYSGYANYSQQDFIDEANRVNTPGAGGGDTHIPQFTGNFDENNQPIFTTPTGTTNNLDSVLSPSPYGIETTAAGQEYLNIPHNQQIPGYNVPATPRGPGRNLDADLGASWTGGLPTEQAQLINRSAAHGVNFVPEMQDEPPVPGRDFGADQSIGWTGGLNPTLANAVNDAAYKAIADNVAPGSDEALLAGSSQNTVKIATETLAGIQEETEKQYVPNIYESIQGHEGYRDEAYQDSAGIWTIGYGRTRNADGSPIQPGQTTSRDQEDAWFKDRVDSDRNYVIRYGQEHGYNWTPNQIDALTSFSYNLGRGGLDQLTAGGSRTNEEILKKIPEYNKAGGKFVQGLLNRRNDEAAMFAGQASGFAGDVPPLESAIPGPGGDSQGGGRFGYESGLDAQQSSPSYLNQVGSGGEGFYGIPTDSGIPTPVSDAPFIAPGSQDASGFAGDVPPVGTSQFSVGPSIRGGQRGTDYEIPVPGVSIQDIQTSEWNDLDYLTLEEFAKDPEMPERDKQIINAILVQRRTPEGGDAEALTVIDETSRSRVITEEGLAVHEARNNAAQAIQNAEESARMLEQARASGDVSRIQIATEQHERAQILAAAEQAKVTEAEEANRISNQKAIEASQAFDVEHQAAIDRALGKEVANAGASVSTEQRDAAAESFRSTEDQITQQTGIDINAPGVSEEELSSIESRVNAAISNADASSSTSNDPVSNPKGKLESTLKGAFGDAVKELFGPDFTKTLVKGLIMYLGGRLTGMSGNQALALAAKTALAEGQKYMAQREAHQKAVEDRRAGVQELKAETIDWNKAQQPEFKEALEKYYQTGELEGLPTLQDTTPVVSRGAEDQSDSLYVAGVQVVPYQNAANSKDRARYVDYDLDGDGRVETYTVPEFRQRLKESGISSENWIQGQHSYEATRSGNEKFIEAEVARLNTEEGVDLAINAYDLGTNVTDLYNEIRRRNPRMKDSELRRQVREATKQYLVDVKRSQAGQIDWTPTNVDAYVEKRLFNKLYAPSGFDNLASGTDAQVMEETIRQLKFNVDDAEGNPITEANPNFDKVFSNDIKQTMDAWRWMKSKGHAKQWEEAAKGTNVTPYMLWLNSLVSPGDLSGNKADATNHWSAYLNK